MSRADEANARALKAALQTLPVSIVIDGGPLTLDEASAEEVVALALRHLVKRRDRS